MLTLNALLRFINTAAVTFYSPSLPSLPVSNSLSIISSASSVSSFSSSHTALSSEPSSGYAIPQDLNNFSVKSCGIPFQARLIQVNLSSLLGALFFPDGVYVNGLFTIHVSCNIRSLALKGLFMHLSRGCNTDVRPPGMTATSIVRLALFSCP